MPEANASNNSQTRTVKCEAFLHQFKPHYNQSVGEFYFDINGHRYPNDKHNNLLIRPDEDLTFNPPASIFTKTQKVKNGKNIKCMKIKLRAFKKGQFDGDSNERIVNKTVEVPMNLGSSLEHVYEWAERGYGIKFTVRCELVTERDRRSSFFGHRNSAAHLTTVLDPDRPDLSENYNPNTMVNLVTWFNHLGRGGPPSWINHAHTVKTYPKVILRASDKIESLRDYITRPENRESRIRCFGLRHAWNDLFSVEPNDILLDVTRMTAIEDAGKDDEGNLYVKVQPGVTARLLNNWVKKYYKGEELFALETDTVIDSLTYGGIISVAAHGAGHDCGAIADQVHEIEIMHRDGHIEQYNRHHPDFWTVVSSLGLCGIIVSLTLKLKPSKKIVAMNATYTLSELTANNAELFKQLIEDWDFSEVFHFPFATRHGEPLVWVKMGRVARTYDAPVKRKHFWHSSLQSLYSGFRDVTGGIFFAIDQFFPHFVRFHGPFMQKFLDEFDGQECISQYDFTHYEPYLVNYPPVWQSEFALKADDLEAIALQFKRLVDQVYEWKNEQNKCPVNTVCEMRVVSSSHATMAMNYGQEGGRWAFIEPMSFAGFKQSRQEDFKAFCTQYFDPLLRDPVLREKFNARPHWGKWSAAVASCTPQMVVDAWPMENIKQFLAVRDRCDPQGKFSNPYLQSVIDAMRERVKNAPQPQVDIEPEPLLLLDLEPVVMAMTAKYERDKENRDDALISRQARYGKNTRRRQ